MLVDPIEASASVGSGSTEAKISEHVEVIDDAIIFS